MITVEVVSVGGLAPSHPMSAQIDQRGGSIGRSPDCTFVLTDDKRAVSRVHGQVSYRDGKFYIEDQGTNPLKVNGAPLGKGNSTVIKSGDRLVIGPYELQVRAATASASAPAATAPGWEPADWSPDAPAPAPAASSGASNPFDDLFGPSSSTGAPSSSSSSGSPFDDLGFGAPAAPPPPTKPSGKPSTAADPFGSFPDDFDPMAPPPAPREEPLLPGAGLPDDAFGPLGAAPQAPGEGSLDALFGLSSGSSPDPFASTPLGAPPPSHAGGTDSGLTQWIGGINAPSTAAPIADKLPELNSAYTPPKAKSTLPPAPQLPADDDGPATLMGSAGALPDFDLDAFGAAPTPSPKPAPSPAPAPAMPAPPRPPVVAPRVPAPAPVSAPRSLGPAAPPSDLLAALLSGLNAPDLAIDELTPELMYKLGVIMHEATAGTIALLNARGTVKREMRADVTMIASGRNNPLKFSPDAGLALRYLFGQPMPGFMSAEEAMHDAYSDLRAHEFGFMAGLRAALAGVLKRFEPSVLESRLPDKGGLNALLPMNRKAKLWELFGELYRQISVEAEEDFHALFGREFLRAYEEHIAALERGQQQHRRK